MAGWGPRSRPRNRRAVRLELGSMLAGFVMVLGGELSVPSRLVRRSCGFKKLNPYVL